MITSSPSHAATALQDHCAIAQSWQLRDLFARDTQRFQQFSLEAAGLFLDYSKNILTQDTVQLLCGLARAYKVEAQRDAMFRGDKINLTEKRAVLHTALRAPRGTKLVIEGRDVNADVHAVLERVYAFAERVRSGAWLGFTGKTITDVVNIGIGGSDLGPEMACHALRSYAQPTLNLHFVANVDGHDLDAALARLNPETTLFVIASKTFTTAETMLNAGTARNWFLKAGSTADLARHFVAVSTNATAVSAFGIDTANMFPFWDWVGGRYSIWSAIGLPLALAIGAEGFAAFLAGAHAMDEHFRNAPLEQNMPVLLAMVGIWNRNYLGSSSISIAPYHQDLSQFADYLQQLEMESNGKRVTRDGTVLNEATCPAVWGNVGTNGQHAYFQLLHQGTDVIPVDFIAALKPNHALPGHQPALLANCFAQSEALMRGKNADEVRAELQAQSLSETDIAALLPHKIFPGNRPSNTILLERLTPASLGALIALYEHKVFVQGAVWNVNSFDQWGVELGKVLAKRIESELSGDAQPQAHDSSTNGLIAKAKAAL
ncbi:MAG: glucose-6-phosphate isomerase [Burkholderiaceae bacterium]|nr:glucose-6-phosphate isomerase [Burkholderiaceae bacterium]